jgi:hypothetical protein
VELQEDERRAVTDAPTSDSADHVAASLLCGGGRGVLDAGGGGVSCLVLRCHGLSQVGHPDCVGGGDDQRRAEVRRLDVEVESVASTGHVGRSWRRGQPAAGAAFEEPRGRCDPRWVVLRSARGGVGVQLERSIHGYAMKLMGSPTDTRPATPGMPRRRRPAARDSGRTNAAARLTIGPRRSRTGGSQRTCARVSTSCA